MRWNWKFLRTSEKVVEYTRGYWRWQNTDSAKIKNSGSENSLLITGWDNAKNISPHKDDSNRDTTIKISPLVIFIESNTMINISQTSLSCDNKPTWTTTQSLHTNPVDLATGAWESSRQSKLAVPFKWMYHNIKTAVYKCMEFPTRYLSQISDRCVGWIAH